MLIIIISKKKENEILNFTDILRKYFELVKTLKYDSTPNYASFKKILHEGLSNVGQKDEWKIDFGSPKVGYCFEKKYCNITMLYATAF